jgi:hypothetical protein
MAVLPSPYGKPDRTCNCLPPVTNSQALRPEAGPNATTQSERRSETTPNETSTAAQPQADMPVDPQAETISRASDP